MVAEPHPSLINIPGIWIGDIQEGILWASTHQEEANARTRLAQTYLSTICEPQIVAAAWSRLIQVTLSTLVVEDSIGPDGSIVTNMPEELMCMPTS